MIIRLRFLPICKFSGGRTASAAILYHLGSGRSNFVSSLEKDKHNIRTKNQKINKRIFYAFPRSLRLNHNYSLQNTHLFATQSDTRIVHLNIFYCRLRLLITKCVQPRMHFLSRIICFFHILGLNK